MNSLEVTSVLKDSQHNFFLRINAVVARLVVMPVADAAAVPVIDGAVPDFLGCGTAAAALLLHGLEQFRADLVAPLVGAFSNLEGFIEQVLPTCGEIQQAGKTFGCVVGTVNMDMDAAGRICHSALFDEGADDGLQIRDVLILENRGDNLAFILVIGIHNMAVHAALWGDGGIPHALPAAALVVYGLVGLVDRAHKAGAYRAVVVGNDLCGYLTGDAGEFDFNAEVLVLDGNHCGGLP